MHGIIFVKRWKDKSLGKNDNSNHSKTIRNQHIFLLFPNLRIW